MEFDELWSCYAFHATILTLKMMWITWQTGQIRYNKKVIHSDADRFFIKEPGVTFDVSGGGHPDVDRARAAHRSDLELVLPFLCITLLWINTNPAPLIAKITLNSFTVSRILHYLVYMEYIRVHIRVKMFISCISYALVALVTISCIAYFY